MFRRVVPVILEDGSENLSSLDSALQDRTAQDWVRLLLAYCDPLLVFYLLEPLKFLKDVRMNKKNWIINTDTGTLPIFSYLLGQDQDELITFFEHTVNTLLMKLPSMTSSSEPAWKVWMASNKSALNVAAIIQSSIAGEEVYRRGELCCASGSAQLPQRGGNRFVFVHNSPVHTGIG